MTEIDMTDTGHAGAFIRKDGIRIFVDLATNLAGEFGWYWCEQVEKAWEGGSIVFTSGRSGVGPFKTCREACHDGLGLTDA